MTEQEYVQAVTQKLGCDQAELARLIAELTRIDSLSIKSSAPSYIPRIFDRILADEIVLLGGKLFDLTGEVSTDPSKLEQVALAWLEKVGQGAYELGLSDAKALKPRADYGLVGASAACYEQGYSDGLGQLP